MKADSQPSWGLVSTSHRGLRIRSGKSNMFHSNMTESCKTLEGNSMAFWLLWASRVGLSSSHPPPSSAGLPLNPACVCSQGSHLLFLSVETQWGFQTQKCLSTGADSRSPLNHSLAMLWAMCLLYCLMPYFFLPHLA